MDSFNKTNLQNIKDIFEKKTCVKLDSRRSFCSYKMVLVTAVLLILCLSTTAFAVNRFSSLSGDDLGLSAVYNGNGIVSILVENRSDKEIQFQSELRLMQWATSEEIEPLAKQNVSFRNTKIPAHSSGTMTIDLSKAYNMALLEKPLAENDWYYFVLTNDHFVFGQDWMCSVDFVERDIIQTEYPTPVTPAEADAKLTAGMAEELRPYFESYTTDPAEKKKLSEEYLALCQKLLEEVDGTVVPSVCPPDLTVIDNGQIPVFDTSVPMDMQLQLTGLHRRTTDGYDKKIGSSDTEQALVLSAYIPQRKGDIDGGVDVPLIYVLTYEKSRITAPQDYAFIRGQLVTFEQMEQYKIYEDGQYVCYDVSRLFYSELRPYVESMVSQRSDAYFDEQVWERVQNIYSYYKENLGSLLSCGESGGVCETVDERDVPNEIFGAELCLNDPENPVSEQNYDVGEPNWND